jgi:N-acetylneuraminic acid mutarotase
MFPPKNRALRAIACLSVALAGCSDLATQPEVAQVSTPVGESAAAASTWISRANLPGIERGGLTTAVVQNASNQSILYAMGGRVIETGGSLGKVQAYNAATNTWTVRASMPIAAYATNGAGVIDGKIYVSGGITRDKVFRNELQVYDPATNTWTLKAAMPDGTWGGVTGVFGGKLYVLTSLQQEDSYIDFVPLSLFRYDPATDRWTELDSSPPQIRRPMGGFIGGRLYVTGATLPSPGGAPLFHAYDPATDQWTSKTPLPKGTVWRHRRDIGSQAVRDRRQPGRSRRQRQTRPYHQRVRPRHGRVERSSAASVGSRRRQREQDRSWGQGAHRGSRRHSPRQQSRAHSVNPCHPAVTGAGTWSRM